MRCRVRALAATVACSAAWALAAAGQAAQLYSQNFNAAAVGSSVIGPGTFVQNSNVQSTGFEIQGGGGGPVSATVGVDNNGVGGTNGLFANWDHSASSSFTFNQYTTYGSVAAAGVGFTAAQVKIDLDLFISGSETSNTPIAIVIQNGPNNLSFTPTLTNGQYTHVSYLLSQASNAGLFAPTSSSNLRLEHGAGGFGFDANNIVRVDNIVIQSIPEPTAHVLAGLGASVLAMMRRRRSP